MKVSEAFGRKSRKRTQLRKTSLGRFETLESRAMLTGNVGSIEFSGDESLTMGRNALNHGTNDITVSAWFKTVNSGANQTIINNGYSRYSFQQHWLGIVGGKLHFNVDVNGSDHVINAAASLENNRWYHSAVTMDRDGSATMYLDGQQVGQVSISDIQNVSFSNYHNYWGTLDVGRGYHYSANREPFQGKIDEARIYQRALSPSQINQIRTSGDTLGTELAYWNFDRSNALGTTTVGSFSGTVVGANWSSDGPSLGGGKFSMQAAASGEPPEIGSESEARTCSSGWHFYSGPHTLTKSNPGYPDYESQNDVQQGFDRASNTLNLPSGEFEVRVWADITTREFAAGYDEVFVESQNLHWHWGVGGPRDENDNDVTRRQQNGDIVGQTNGPEAIEYGIEQDNYDSTWGRVSLYVCRRDRQPIVTISDAAADEGDTLRFKVELIDADGLSSVGVSYGLEDITARRNLDYQGNTGSVTLTPQSPIRYIDVNALEDDLVEPDETFRVRANVQESSEITAIGTIYDVPPGDDLTVDLDIDSDNTGTISGSNSEDAIEDDTDKPGKIIQVHSGDTDGDGLVDYQDFYGANETIDTTTKPVPPSQPYTQVKLRLDKPEFNKSARVSFSYHGADPRNALSTGSLRLWADDIDDYWSNPSNVSQNGDYIAPSNPYTIQQLINAGAKLDETSDEMVLTLFAEGVKPSVSQGDKTIAVTATPAGSTESAEDRVRATLVRWDVVKLDDAGQSLVATPTNEIKESTASPTFDFQTTTRTFGIPGNIFVYGLQKSIVDGTEVVVGSVYILGQVKSAYANTQDNGAEVREVHAVANYNNPMGSAPIVQQIRNPTGKAVERFDYAGEFAYNFSNVVFHDGPNTIALFAQVANAGASTGDQERLQGNVEFEFIIDAKSQSTPILTQPPLRISQSDGGELNPYGLQYFGPSDIDVAFTTPDGGTRGTVEIDGKTFASAETLASTRQNRAGNAEKLMVVTNRLVEFNRGFYNLSLTEEIDFGKGFLEGFFKDGLVGTFEGAKQLASGTISYTKKAVKFYANFGLRLVGRDEYQVDFTKEGQFLYSSGKFVQNAAQLMKQVHSEIHQFQYDTIAALIAGDSAALAEQSETLRGAFQLAGTLLIEFADFMTKSSVLNHYNVGRVTGMIVYEAAETMLTAGAAKAMKSGKIGSVATTFLNKINTLVKQGKMPAVVNQVLLRYGYKVGDTIVPAKVAEMVYDAYDKFCFTRDTLVWTTEGAKPIGTIEVGESVLAFDFSKGEWVPSVVIARHDNSVTGEMIKITVGDDQIEVTRNHPFWVVEGQGLSDRRVPDHLTAGEDEGVNLRGRWVDSQDLLVGDVMIDRHGNQHPIASVETRQGELVEVSNLSIDVNHSFAVANLGILVHNASFCQILRDATNPVNGTGPSSNLLAAAKRLGLKIHGHHIVQKKIPAMFNLRPTTGGNRLIKNYAQPDLVNWTPSEISAWYIGKSQELMKAKGIPLLDADDVANNLGKNGDKLYNLTWAVNGDQLHTWRSQKVVYDNLVAAGTKTRMENALKMIGATLANGDKLF